MISIRSTIPVILSGIAGMALFSYLYSSNRYIPSKPYHLNQEISVANQELVLSYIPQRIQIPLLNLDMAIREASVSDNSWEIYDDAIAWLKSSGDLNSGNMVLYGHNDKELFAKIIQLGIGDTIIVSNSDRSQTYKVLQALETSPNDLSLIRNQEDRLTLYTCSGLFDSKRYFVIAERVHNE